MSSERASRGVIWSCKAAGIRTIAIETIRPDVAAGRKISKGYVDPDVISVAPHRALYCPPDAELLAECLKVDLLVFICKSCSAPNDERAGHLREIGRQVGRNAVGEIVLLGIVIEVREWQDDERRAVTGRAAASLCVFWVSGNRLCGASSTHSSSR